MVNLNFVKRFKNGIIFKAKLAIYLLLILL